MTRQPNTPRKQQFYFPCKHCPEIFKKNAEYILHNKEEHGIEL